MTPDISCRSLTQIELQIPRWQIKWRPCKAMAVSQAFIFQFKCYSILHFAVCQLLCWAFLLPVFYNLLHSQDTQKVVLTLWTPSNFLPNSCRRRLNFSHTTPRRQLIFRKTSPGARRFLSPKNVATLASFHTSN